MMPERHADAACARFAPAGKSSVAHTSRTLGTGTGTLTDADGAWYLVVNQALQFCE